MTTILCHRDGFDYSHLKYSRYLHIFCCNDPDLLSLLPIMTTVVNPFTCGRMLKRLLTGDVRNRDNVQVAKILNSAIPPPQTDKRIPPGYWYLGGLGIGSGLLWEKAEFRTLVTCTPLVRKQGHGKICFITWQDATKRSMLSMSKAFLQPSC